MDLLIEELESGQVIGYTIVSATSLVCYEYLIMLDNEASHLTLG